MNSSSSAYVAELAIALQAAKKRIQELENEKLLASDTPEDGANQTNDRFLSKYYGRLNAVMGEQLSTMQATFFELRRRQIGRGDEGQEQTLATLEAKNAELTTENERLNTRTVSLAELREVERENRELSARCAELQGEVANTTHLQTKYAALQKVNILVLYDSPSLTNHDSRDALQASSDWQGKHDALEALCAHLKSTEADSDKKINELLHTPLDLQNKNDALEKRCATLRSQNANLHKKIQKLLSTTQDAPANNSSRKRKIPSADAEGESEANNGRRAKKRRRMNKPSKRGKNQPGEAEDDGAARRRWIRQRKTLLNPNRSRTHCIYYQ
ncbi:hypothetical protein C8F04DRAFT_1169887 [Mycena alexandri]|uniref:Uncharacterized protein n=1 Tax=Mycena alexandri TaxID=1745969 RepID=A0AAD6WLR7_9AGAR|nr:hypothetical protein C8F04DRAFT_1169887 [Mycena alexandri]